MAIFQESTSKYPSLPNSELQDLEKYLLLHHNDVIEALNLEIDSFLKNLYQNTQLTKFLLSILKNTKVTRPSMFPIMTSL